MRKLITLRLSRSAHSYEGICLFFSNVYFIIASLSIVVIFDFDAYELWSDSDSLTEISIHLAHSFQYMIHDIFAILSAEIALRTNTNLT